MAPSWLNPAGGLRYHVRALLGGANWQPFRDSLAVWLAEFEPASGRALLVGPSAGYTLPDAFLRRFSSLTVLEPDPIAGLLLMRRLRRLGIAELHWEREDLLIEPLLRGTPGIAARLSADPGLCLVFGNVLGQTSFLLSDADFDRFKAAFRAQLWPLLADRSWLSVHDRFSGKLAPGLSSPHRSPTRLIDAAVLELYDANHASSSVELFDHQSDGFFPSDSPHSYFTWRIAHDRYHLIEGVMHSAPSQAVDRPSATRLAP